MTNKAYIYCRVSTDEQAKKGYGLDGQERECREYAERQGLAVERVFTDDYTGRTLDRPGMNAYLEALAFDNEVKNVIAHRPDRISRDDVDYLIFLRDMERLGVRVFLCNKGEVKRERGAKKIVNYLDGWEGNEDNEKRTEVTTQGRRDKARGGKGKPGKWVGNGFAPYGYRAEGKHEERRLVIDPKESEVVRRIFAWYTGADGKRPFTLMGILKKLTTERIPPPARGPGGVNWYPATVRAILDRPAYIGEFNFAGITINLPELAIIDSITFERVKMQRKQNRARSARFAKRKYLMTGHFRCACGSTMNAYMGGTGYAYYICARRRNHKHTGACNQTQIPQRKVEEMVCNWLKKILKDADALDAGINRLIERQKITLSARRERLATVRELIADVDSTLVALAGDLRQLKGEAGRAVVLQQIEALSTRRQGLDDERAELESELRAGEFTEEDRATIKRIAAELREDIDGADFDDMRYVMGRLNIQVRHRIDDSSEWLDARCELSPDEVGLRIS